MDVVDVMIYETGSGGDINLKNDDLETVSGLTNQIYLALVGGNYEQNTGSDLDDLEQRFDWWGNILLNEENQLNSNFERELSNINLTSAGVSALENAAKKDLKFLDDYANITISGIISGIDKFELQINVEEPSELSTKLKFIWDARSKELIETITV